MPGNSTSVLIVEDDRDFAETLVIALGTRHCRTEVAGSGEEAVRLFQQNQYDIAFMDIKLPGMSGVQSLAKIRAINPQARVVMMTGFSEAAMLDQALSAGAMDILRKPFRMRELLSFIDRLQNEATGLDTESPTTH